MTALRRHLSLHRWPAAWLVALALAVRLIVPAGFMPMAGQAALQICAGQTPNLPAVGLPVAAPAPAPAIHAMPGMGAAHAMHATHAPPAHDADHGGKPMSGASDHDCGFGAAIGGAAALSTVILPALLAPVALPVAFLAAMRVRPGLGLAAPPPPKTGPPILLR